MDKKTVLTILSQIDELLKKPVYCNFREYSVSASNAKLLELKEFILDHYQIQELYNGR